MNQNNPNFRDLPIERPKAKQKEMPLNPKDLIGSKKIDLSLIPPSALAEIALALMYGATCYDPYNWRVPGKKVGYMTYIAADKRHSDSFIDGEDIAPDSLVSHLAHKAAGICVLIDAIKCGNAIDDRPHKGVASQVHAEINEKLPDLIKHWQELKKQREEKMKK